MLEPDGKSEIMQLIGIVAAISAVVGVLANNRKLRVCFLVFMLSNILAGYVHACAIYYQPDIWPLLARDVIFFLLAIEGWVRWGK